MTDPNSTTELKTALVPSHERAAAERRIKGNRPSIAAVMYQNSGIISAALNGGQDINQLSKKYRLQDNMYTLNKARYEKKKKADFDRMRERRQSKGFSMNVSPCRRLTIFVAREDDE